MQISLCRACNLQDTSSTAVVKKCYTCLLLGVQLQGHMAVSCRVAGQTFLTGGQYMSKGWYQTTGARNDH